MRRFHRQVRTNSRPRWRGWATQAGRFVKGIAKRLTVTRVAFILLGLPLAFYVYREVTRDVLIIDPVAVPKQFEEAGLTPQVMANRVGDKLQEMEKSTDTYMRKDVLGAGQQELTVPEIEIPGTKLGLRSIVEVGRSIFGRHSKHIGGDIVISEKVSGVVAADDPVVVTAYFIQEQIGRQSLSAEIASRKIPDLVQRLAELALRQINPYVLACYKADHKDFDQAAAIAEEMTRDPSLDKQHRKAAFKFWGDVLDDGGKHEEAMEKYAKAVEIDPKFAYAYFGWGAALNNARRYEEAIAKSARGIELDPKDPDPYYNWGMALYGEGRYEDAIAKFAEAVKVDPKDSESYFSWGIALDREGKFEEATKKYAKAVELYPKSVAAYYDWGLALEGMGKHEEAIAKYGKVVELDPKFVYAYDGWGIALEAEGKHDEAIAKFAKAVEVDPKFAYAYFDWGNALDSEKKYEEATAKYAKAVELEPKNIYAYRRWGLDLRRLGREKEAQEKYSTSDKIAMSH